MLSDIFMKKDTKGETSEINTQIKRLENLSISMSNLIASGNSDKIMHLEKIRKKIITDITKKKIKERYIKIVWIDKKKKKKKKKKIRKRKKKYIKKKKKIITIK